VTRDEASAEAVRYWLLKSAEALAAAEDEQRAGRLSFSVNRAYYAAFYAASAVLLKKGHRFARHSGVRAALHRHLVKPGLLPEAWGRFYDRLFEDRQQGDYVEFVSFEADDVTATVVQTRELVTFLARLADQ
jgi:uncharacterized protein (UPF0332 family)